MSELLDYSDYDDWLDSRYGRFMGLSISGVDASLETVALDDFLDWCGARRMRPTEAALDVYASNSTCASAANPSRRPGDGVARRSTEEPVAKGRKKPINDQDD